MASPSRTHRAFMRSAPVALAGVATLASLAVACRTRSNNETVVRQDAPTAAPSAPSVAPSLCLTIQGNGAWFASILGQAAALLDSGLDPVFVYGGSSGSISAAIIRGSVVNPSVRATSVIDASGRALDVPQRAARLLTALSLPIQTFHFLPSLNRTTRTLVDVAKFLVTDQLADAFVGSPEQQVAHLESITGQAALFVDFVAHEDFSAELRENDLSKRQALIMEKWVRFGDFKIVKPTHFIKSLFLSSKSPAAGKSWAQEVKGKEGVSAEDFERIRGWYDVTPQEIKERYFELFRSEEGPARVKPRPWWIFRKEKKTADDPVVSLANYEKFLGALHDVGARIDDVDEAKLGEAFQRTIESMRDVPFVGSLANTASKDFFLPDHRRIWAAYNGVSRFGGRIEIPDGALLHTTARVADRQGDGSLLERTGFETFFQTYFPSKDLSSELLSLYGALPEDRGFLEVPKAGGGADALLRKKNHIIVESLSLPEAVKLSIAEPNQFRRDEIPLSDAIAARHGLTQTPDRRHVTFGGWMDHQASAFLARFDRCKNADYFASISGRGDGLRGFQRRAFRAVIEGAPSVWTMPLREKEEAGTQTISAIDLLERYMNHSDTIRGRKGRVKLTFNWDTPSPSAELTKLLWDNRPGFFLAAYQQASRDVASHRASNPAESATLKEGALARDLMSPDVSKFTTAEQLLAATRKLTSGLD